MESIQDARCSSPTIHDHNISNDFEYRVRASFASRKSAIHMLMAGVLTLLDGRLSHSPILPLSVAEESQSQQPEFDLRVFNVLYAS